MKRLKMLGLAAMAALTLFAITGAGSASATALCKKNVTPCGAEVWGMGQAFKASLETGTESVFTFKSELGQYEIKCSGSSMNGKIESFGSEGIPAVIKLELLSFTECGCEVNTLKPGSLNVAWTKGTMNGGMTTGNNQVTFFCMSDCVYGEGPLGVLTGGAMGTIDVDGEMKKISGGFLCPEHAIWEAAYTVTAPEPIYVAEKN